MKNKLHTTVCHPELVEGSYPVCHSYVFTKLWSLSWSLSLSKCLILFLFLLSSFLTHAQTYNWKWAVSGGGSFGSGSWTFQVEQVFDVQVGTDNNYYFLAKMQDGNPQLGGQPVTVYGNGGHDIFIFSTTCDGTVRWSQAIGGGDKIMHTR